MGHSHQPKFLHVGQVIIWTLSQDYVQQSENSRKDFFYRYGYSIMRNLYNDLVLTEFRLESKEQHWTTLSICTDFSFLIPWLTMIGLRTRLLFKPQPTGPRLHLRRSLVEGGPQDPGIPWKVILCQLLPTRCYPQEESITEKY